MTVAEEAVAARRPNETVRVIDNFSTGKRENVKPFAGRAEIIENARTAANAARRFSKCRKLAEYGKFDVRDRNEAVSIAVSCRERVLPGRDDSNGSAADVQSP